MDRPSLITNTWENQEGDWRVLLLDHEGSAAPCLSKHIKRLRLDVTAQAFNPITQEAEAGRSLWGQGQPGPQGKFSDNQGYTEKPCLKKQNKQTNKNSDLDGELLLWKLTLEKQDNPEEIG